MDDLKNIAPELSKIEKENSFSVPDGYFDKLPMQIQEKLQQKKAFNPAFLMELLKRPAYVLSFSIMILLIIIIPFAISTYNSNLSNGQIAYQDFDITDIEYFEINEELLIEAISFEEFDENELIEEAIDEMMNYIIDNVDYTTILDEL